MSDPTFTRARNALIPTARIVRAMMVAKGDPMAAYAFADAKPHWANHPEIRETLEKAITAPMSTASDAASLWSRVGRQVSDALQPLTIFGRLQSQMRRLPFRTRVIFSADSTEARFVGEATTGAGSAATSTPITKLSFSEDGTFAAANLDFAKLSLIAVHTAELARVGPKGTDEHIAGELLRSLIKGLDTQFVDPSRLFDAAREAPASVTSAGTVIDSTGSTLAAIDNDLGLMVNALVDAGMPLTSAHWVMSPITASSLARLRGSSGAPAFPGIGANGGELLGLPVLCSAACAAAGSPGERFLALIEASEISYADDSGASIEYTTQADLEMSDGPTGTATTLRSLWQSDLAACRVTKFVNWVARDGAAAVLRNVAY